MDTGGGNTAPFWRDWQIGERVIVRYRRALATPQGRARAAGDTAVPSGADNKFAEDHPAHTAHTATPAGTAAAATDARDHGPPFSDALGEVVSVGDDGVTVRTRRGDISVPARAITLGKRVPPAPARRRREAG